MTVESGIAEARYDILRHEYRADFVDKNIRELNRQIESQRMGIGHTLTGYEQSRREQDPLHEELAERERALRETRFKSIHEMEELKRDHELRVDDFSRRKLIENQDSINELTARIQELKTKSIVRMILGILKMPNLYAVDNCPTFPVNQRCFQALVNQEECKAAINVCSQR